MIGRAKTHQTEIDPLVPVLEPLPAILPHQGPGTASTQGLAGCTPSCEERSDAAGLTQSPVDDFLRATTTVEIRVRGRVQGVGFRPTVWRYARELGLNGVVLNDSEGVLIRVAGNASTVRRSVSRVERAATAGTYRKRRGPQFELLPVSWKTPRWTVLRKDAAFCFETITPSVSN